MNTTLTKTIFFQAQPEKVWKYLTDKDKLGEWYHPAKNNLVEGEDYTLLTEGEDGKLKAQVWGRVLEMTPYSKLVTTFCIGPFGGNETILTWVLESAAGGTRLSLKHEGIAEAGGAAALQLLTALDNGWDSHFAKIRSAISM